VSDDKIPCWIVWRIDGDKAPIVAAVDTTEALAVRHRMAILAEARMFDRVVRVQIEPRELNHLYGANGL